MSKILHYVAEYHYIYIPSTKVPHIYILYQKRELNFLTIMCLTIETTIYSNKQIIILNCVLFSYFMKHCTI